MDDDFFRRDYDHGHPPHDNLFAWTVFILLLIGFALACWLGSFYVISHPENPRSYGILMKLKKLDPPKRFDLTAAPQGEFLTPQKLYEKYSTMPDGQLAQENAELLRDYIRNYQDTKKLVPYLIGRFSIINAYALKSDNLFSTGVVALARASEYPQVVVEHVYTADSSTVPQLLGMLTPGLDIKLEKTLELSAIIHIEKLEDGRLQLTAVPLLYGSYALKEGEGTFSLEPPTKLHLEGGVPILKSSMLPSDGKVYAARTPAPDTGEAATTAEATPAATPATAELVRVMPPVAVSTPFPTPATAAPAETPVPTPAPAIAVATPVRKLPPTPAPLIAQATPPPDLAPVVAPSAPPVTLARNTTPVPLQPFATPAPEQAMPSATPPPAVAVDHPGVPLTPFIEARATPGVNTTGGTWKVFHPGQMPRGRLVKVTDASDMADRGVSGERLYLSGQFTVTASGENRAVLRSKGGLLSTINPLDHSGSSSTRILVEFPAGYQPPAEGSTINRDAQRPFEIRDVERAKDGTINVYVREVTTPD